MLTQTNANLSPNDAAKTNPSPLTSGNIFKFTGSISFKINGRVTTNIQVQVTTVKISVKPDALAAFDICTTLDISGFAAGSLLTIDGTPGDAMKGTTGVGVAVDQVTPILATCVTSGIITVTYGAASTGGITWEIEWAARNAKGNVAAV